MEQDLLDTLSSALKRRSNYRNWQKRKRTKPRGAGWTNEALEAKEASLNELQSELHAAETREEAPPAKKP